MLRRALPLLLFVACTTAPSIPRNNPYNQEVVDYPELYQRLVQLDPDKQLVDVQQVIPGVSTDLSLYKRSRSPLYREARVYLRKPVALALLDVQLDLASDGLGVKIFDGYRPYSFAVRMWRDMLNPDFSANPQSGSMSHSRGAAVDLTLIDLRTGQEIAMPTEFDALTPGAAQDFRDLPSDVIANRAKLRDVMTRHGFQPLRTAWWHFDYQDWKRFELMDVSFPQLAEIKGMPAI